MLSINKKIDKQQSQQTKSQLVDSLFDDELSDELLQQKIAAAIDAPLQVSHSEIHYGLPVAGSNLLFENNLYCEVIEFTDPAKLPNTPQHFLGLCNLRGNLIPVYQLSSEQETCDTSYQYIFIIGQKDNAAALALEHLPQRIDLAKVEPIKTEPSNINLVSLASTSCYKINDTLWHMINSKELFKELASSAASHPVNKSANNSTDTLIRNPTNNQAPTHCDLSEQS